MSKQFFFSLCIAISLAPLLLAQPPQISYRGVLNAADFLPAGLPVSSIARGSGGRLLIGLGFKVPANGTYTDLDRKSKGAFTIQSGVITFHGGHLDGQTGRNLHGNKFVLGSMVSCEPFH